MAKKVIKVTNMTSAEMVKAVAAKSGATQVQTKNVLDAMGEVCRECAAAGKQFNLFGFGKLKFAIVKGKPEREGIINPSTGEPPNTLKVDQQTIAGRNANVVPDNTSTKTENV